MFLNHHNDGLVKKKMTDAFTTSSQSDKLPKSFYRNFRVKNKALEGYPVYVISRRGSEQPDGRVLFLHGGGGMMRPTKLHFDTVMKLVRETNCELYFAYYPIAPKANVLEALAWCEKLYQNMLRTCEPQNITFIGDSAGANLCISLCERIKHRPTKMILISMAAGLDNDTGRQLRIRAEHKDPLLSVEMNDIIAKYWARGVSLKSADINPDFATFRDFPRLLFVHGTHELFYPCVKNILKRLDAEEIPYEKIELPLCHDFALCSFFPEGRMAIDAMVKFICDKTDCSKVPKETIVDR